MNKKTKGVDAPHFDYGISNSHDMFKKLLYEGDKLSEECHPYDCFNFFVTAWHLYYDWLEKDSNRPKLAGRKKGKTPKLMQNLLETFKKLANGSKHMTLKSKKSNEGIIIEIHPPCICDWRSYFSNKEEMPVKINDFSYSTWDMRYIVTHYFTWIFDDETPADQFPVEVQKHLERGLLKK